MQKTLSLQDLFLKEIQDLYDAEQQLVQTLPEVANACSNQELRQAFEQHVQQTAGHVDRLTKIFESLGEDPRAMPCKAMRGLIEEGRELISNTEPSPVRDAGLIGAAQRIEHYEMAGYGTAGAFAEALGYEDAAALLQDTLDEEGEANEKLTLIAEDSVNIDATQFGTGQQLGAEAMAPAAAGPSGRNL
ncbi:MAG TPA: ferritin-like domain-containing protein [Bryobacteraceae bacterium]|nr:ferritin-like domain-containing protein [Bryobacteraceae bacterium]